MKPIRKRIGWMLFGIVFVVVLLLLTGFVSIRRDWGYICTNTGSRKTYSRWIIGLKTGESYSESALEKFMRQAYPDALQHNWVSYAGTGRSIYGGVTDRGHGRPGPISKLSIECLNWFVANHNPQENLELYDLFARGDEDVIRRRIEQIWDEWLESKNK